MTLERLYFERDYHYNPRLTNKCIAIIRFARDEKRVKAYKNLLFKMMKDIVLKNVGNYTNLLRGVEINPEDIPERDELIAECFIIFDKCVEKFAFGRGFNFYFYFNKALSRNFFREYQREKVKNRGVELSEAILTVVEDLHQKENPDLTEFMFERLEFTELEIKICNSRLLGQKTSEFLRDNPDVNNNQYSRSLKKIKEVLCELQTNGDI